MTAHLIEGVEIFLWPNPHGLSAFAAPWTFDLEYDVNARGTIDAYRFPLNAGDYPSKVDHYRVLDGPSRARILRSALDSRGEYRDFTAVWKQYLVRHQHPGIDEAAFLRIVAAFMHACRRQASTL